LPQTAVSKRGSLIADSGVHVVETQVVHISRVSREEDTQCSRSVIWSLNVIRG
jgi:hypothetical protein